MAGRANSITASIPGSPGLSGPRGADANTAGSSKAPAASSAAGSGGGAGGGGGGRASKRALREFYGIQAAAAGADDSIGSAGVSELADAGVSRDPHDPDSPNFNAGSCYNSLISTLSLAELLKKSAELLTEIRELDGEKQSLVYNHHHELVAASETIRKMKTRADGLDPSLDSLQASFSTMSQLAETLVLPSNLTSSITARSTRTAAT
ncbi:hypothetical protein V8E36_000637 [Tilletia maclaganii]